MLWTREFLLTQIFIFIRFLSLDLCKVFDFGSLSSDDEDPKRDAATAPLLDTLAASKVPSQEAAMVVKSPEAPAKKGTPARASKRLKKAMAAGAYLDTHRSVGSPDDVSNAFYDSLFLLLEFFFSCLPLGYSDEKIPLSGN
jgi:hypothetical protein